MQFGATVKGYKEIVRARKTSSGYYHTSTIPASVPAAAGFPLLSKPKMTIQEWLKATGKSLKGLAPEARQEVCREFICYSRGNVYMSPSERNAECFQAVATVLV